MATSPGQLQAGRQLGQYIAEGLSFNLEDLGIGGYQAMVLATIKGKIDAALTGEWRESLEASVENILRVAPPTITLSELLTTLAKDHVDEARRNGWDRAVLTREESEYGATWISLSAKGEGRRSVAEWSFGVMDDKVFAVQVGGKEQRALLAGTLYGMERLLFLLQHGRTTIVMDLPPGEHEHFYDW